MGPILTGLAVSASLFYLFRMLQETDRAVATTDIKLGK
jgi:hypothetical protein